jgi:AcrR family transcriptional regulator
MDAPLSRSEPRRNKGFEETHRELIETAVRLISEKGADALSIAALARAMGINRTTVYYHFDSREALLSAVTSWATAELAKGMDVNASRPERAGHISRFVLENPELIRLWINDFVDGSDIRDSYSPWDELVAGMAKSFREMGEDIDAEIYCVMLIGAAIIGPRVYKTGIRQGEDTDSIVARFVKEHQRVLKRDGLIKDGE